MYFLPKDVLEIVVEHLDIYSKCSLRRVVRFDWTTKNIFEHSRFMISKPIRIRRKCMECEHNTISFLYWQHGQKRNWIPWCHLHASKEILKNVDCFCIGDATCVHKEWYV